MLKLFSAFRKNKIWDFNGGIHPPEMKTQSNGCLLYTSDAADEL
ncbi:hypothetical protein ACX3VG_30790, partial [Escherichia coli]